MTSLTLEPLRPELAASEKQISFVQDLIAAREVEDHIADNINESIELGVYSKKHASHDIDAFLKLPKRAKVTKPSNAMQSLLASVPKSKYAIPADELELSSIEIKNDLLFVEIKEYMSTLYMRQLHGAPGRFNRSKLTTEQVEEVVSILANNPYKYTRIFGEHYACCGSCGAELTDARSRELQLGPECRKKFGF
jgi:hypothetical protein